MSDRRASLIVALVLLLAATPLTAQQPSVSIVGATQFVTGETIRLAGQNRVEPDLRLVFFNPGFRFGALEADFSVTRRDDQAVLGRSFLRLGGVKLGGSRGPSTPEMPGGCRR
jgi:hypothetical protein